MKPGGQVDGVRDLKARYQVFVIGAILIWVLLIGRLFQMQILEGERFSRQARRNFTSIIDVEAPRGRIFDRHRRLVATNRPAYSLWAVAIPRVSSAAEGSDGKPIDRRVPVTDEQIADLAQYIDFADFHDRNKFLKSIQKLRDDPKTGRYPVKVRSNLSREEMSRIVTRRELRSWVDIRESARRYYPEGSMTAFVTGHMNAISEQKLQAFPGYRRTDRVGITGIERERENYLRGRLGARSRVVDHLGREVRNPPRSAVFALPPDVEAIPGQDIYLTLDVELQRIAVNAFAGKKAGALVAMDVHSGEILAMVSVPSIDPNRRERPIAHAEWNEWVSSPFKPLTDKTVQQHFFPGSTYKVVSAMAMLEDPNFNPREETECHGYFEYGGRRFKDTHRHGKVDLRRAIIQSCNVYFYKLAADKNLTLSRMERTARSLGLGDRTGLGINSEVRGVVPTEASELQQGTFQGGVKLNSVIGQGNVKATVLQMTTLYAAIANGGYVLTPVLVDRIETFQGKVVIDAGVQPKGTQMISPEQRKIIHEGLKGVVNNEHGTAYSERLEGVVVAGKTGTAQVGKKTANADEPKLEGWDTTKDHAWFAAYAPADKPEISVVAFVEHGGVGADAAAPIVMSVIRHYLQVQSSGKKTHTRGGGEPPPLPGKSRSELSPGLQFNARIPESKQ